MICVKIQTGGGGGGYLEAFYTIRFKIDDIIKIVHVHVLRSVSDREHWSNLVLFALKLSYPCFISLFHGVKNQYIQRDRCNILNWQSKIRCHAS